MMHTPKIVAHQKHPVKILHKENYAHGFFGTTKAKYNIWNNKVVTKCQILYSKKSPKLEF